MEISFKTKIIDISIPTDCNVIFGQAHFVKTVEDLYETIITASASLQFGIAFCEASQKRLVRTDGNDPEMTKAATEAAFDVACGHTFFVFLKGGFPINVLGRIKNIDETCRIFCATANPLQVLVAETKQGRGVLGVVDGESPLGVESAADRAERVAFLKTIGYKR